jgi:CBS domain-containing protein
MKAVYVARREPDTLGVLARRSVKHAMSSPVVCVSAAATPGEALRAMVSARHRHLLVIDDAGHFLGVLADRAVAAAWAHDPDALDRGTVAGLLDPEPAFVGETDRVVDAARKMRAGGVDAVAVVNATGHPVGILTGTDLIALIAR